jgi:hypothetical protein
MSQHAGFVATTAAHWNIGVIKLTITFYDLHTWFLTITGGSPTGANFPKGKFPPP